MNNEQPNLDNLKSELLSRISEIEIIKGKAQSRDVATVPLAWFHQLLKWLKEENQSPPGPIDTSSLLLPSGSIDENKKYLIDFHVIEVSIWKMLTQFFPCNNPIYSKITQHPANGSTVIILKPINLKLITPTKLVTKTCASDWLLLNLKRPLCLFIRVISDEYHFVSPSGVNIEDNTRIGDYSEVYGNEIKLLPKDNPQKSNSNTNTNSNLTSNTNSNLNSNSKPHSNSISQTSPITNTSKLLINTTFKSITNSANSGRSKSSFSNSPSFNKSFPEVNSNKSQKTPTFSPGDLKLTFPAVFQPQKSNALQLIPKSTRFPRPIGIPNIGNSCYFNSVIQSIIRIEPFYNFLVSDQFEKSINKTNPGGSGGKIANEFRNLVIQMTNTSSDVYNISNFQKIFCSKFPEFGNFNQHDAQELLGCILNILHEDLLQLNKTKKFNCYTPRSQSKLEKEPDQQFSPIGDLFFSLMEVRIKCPKCSFVKSSKEHFLFFPLSLPDQSQEVSIISLIKQFQNPETLDSDNGWFCDKCKMQVEASKQSLFKVASDILIIHLKRFALGNFGMIKIETPVSYPMEFSGELLTSSEYHIYKLISVVFHVGTLNSGHYTAANFDPVSKHWYLYNDSKATEITPENVNSPNAYLLIYQKLV